MLGFWLQRHTDRLQRRSIVAAVRRSQCGRVQLSWCTGYLHAVIVLSDQRRCSDWAVPSCMLLAHACMRVALAWCGANRRVALLLSAQVVLCASQCLLDTSAARTCDAARGSVYHGLVRVLLDTSARLHTRVQRHALLVGSLRSRYGRLVPNTRRGWCVRDSCSRAIAQVHEQQQHVHEQQQHDRGVIRSPCGGGERCPCNAALHRP